MKYSVILLVLLLVSCERENKSAVIENIDLYTAYQERKPVPISTIAEKISYIPLETNEYCLMGNRRKNVAKVDSFIVYWGYQQIYLFNARNGKFVREISGAGRGPKEYHSVDLVTLRERERLLTVNRSKITKDSRSYTVKAAFSFDGDMVKTYRLPASSFSNENMFKIFMTWPVGNQEYIGYVNNDMGDTQYKAAFFNDKGEITSYIKNFNKYDKEKYPQGPHNGMKGWFYNLQDTVRFFEQYTDTIYSLDGKSLVPRFHVVMKDLAPPYYLQGKPDAYKKEELDYFRIRYLYESNRFVFFITKINRFDHQTLYDKKLHKTIMCDTDEDREYYKYPAHYSERTIGYINDLDGFLPIGTSSTHYVNSNNELITTITPIEIHRWFKQNPGKKMKLREDLRKLENIPLEANPVVIIVKLKSLL